MTISQRIFYLLENQGKSQKELAKFTGIKSNTISDWKTKGTNPSSDKISRICEFFNISTDWLLTGEGEMNRHTQTDIPPPDELGRVVEWDEFYELKQDEKIMIRYYREITDKGKDEATKLMLELRDKYKTPKPDLPGDLLRSDANEDFGYEFNDSITTPQRKTANVG